MWPPLILAATTFFYHHSGFDRAMDSKLNRESGESAKLINFVKDRAGHDMRYAIDASKINRELGLGAFIAI